MTDSLTDSIQRRIDSMRNKAASPMGEAQLESLREEVLWIRRDLERQKELVEKLLADAAALQETLSRRPRSLTPAGAPEFRSDRPTPSDKSDHLGASTFIEKGWNLISAGDFPGAEEALRKALSLASDEVEALNLLGWAQMYQDKLDDALMTFQSVILRQPDSSSARINIGYICLRKKIFGEAIEHLSRVIRSSADRKSTLYAHFYLGLLYFEREMFDDAISFFRTARTLGPNLVEVSYELGRALWFHGDKEGARQAWREGHASNKFSPWGKRCAELLQQVDAGGQPPRQS